MQILKPKNKGSGQSDWTQANPLKKGILLSYEGGYLW